jgi:hypothetical protein
MVNRGLNNMITMDFRAAKVAPATVAEGLDKATPVSDGSDSVFRFRASDVSVLWIRRLVRLARGGVVRVTPDGDRVHLADRAVTALSGTLRIQPPNSH